jgi:DNA-binding IclR family transcriptional regulator
MPRVRTGESVVSRVVRVLEAFTPDEPALSVTEIGRRSGLHVATASRLVAELAAHGLLVRRDGEVRVGVRMWELAQRASPTLSMREAAMPFLEDVHAVIGQHVQLGVLDGDEVLFVERMSAPNAVINYTRIAGRLAPHASSSGLVLLAHAPAEQQERVLAAPLLRFTPRTPTRPAQVREMLADVRRQGYALCPGFFHLDAAGVAVPVRDGSGTVVAAIGAVVPNDGNAYLHVPALMAAARGIGRLLASH